MPEQSTLFYQNQHGREKPATPEQTRDESYEKVDLTPMQRRVLNELKKVALASNRDIAQILGKYPNSITGRMKELREKGRVVQAGTKEDPDTGRTVTTWKPAEDLFDRDDRNLTQDDEEIWRPVQRFEGIYEVSSHGRVRSVDRVVEYSDGRVAEIDGQILSICDNGRGGYPKVTLYDGDSVWQVLVHRLVAEAFLPS